MSSTQTAAVLGELGAATLGETGARGMPPRIRPAWSGAAVAGPAYPVRCTPGDNLAIHVAVTQAPAGSVLVVDVGKVPDRGYWGEVLTTGALARGLGRPGHRRRRAGRGCPRTAGLPRLLLHDRPPGCHQGLPAARSA